ncbi:unnamed protein product [Paramecium primaurelia]|uniref:Uncharacterized protein n=1 Tax=Paramecium primaurelia TaxID=5886 RepID=A0A8S1M575_PARPR|nr:unnamed protein product [Paramecium primaurelia]
MEIVNYVRTEQLRKLDLKIMYQQMKEVTSIWESVESNFQLENNLNQFSSYCLSQSSKYMPAIRRRESGDKTIILESLIIKDIPIENDPDYLTICSEPVKQKKFKPKMNYSQLLKLHFSTLRK